jgi:hypothetical protein
MFFHTGWATFTPFTPWPSDKYNGETLIIRIMKKRWPYCLPCDYSPYFPTTNNFSPALDSLFFPLLLDLLMQRSSYMNLLLHPILNKLSGISILNVFVIFINLFFDLNDWFECFITTKYYAQILKNKCTEKWTVTRVLNFYDLQ